MRAPVDEQIVKSLIIKYIYRPVTFDQRNKQSEGLVESLTRGKMSDGAFTFSRSVSVPRAFAGQVQQNFKMLTPIRPTGRDGLIVKSMARHSFTVE